MGLPSPGPRKGKRGIGRGVVKILRRGTRVTLWVKLTVERFRNAHKEQCLGQMIKRKKGQTHHDAVLYRCRECLSFFVSYAG
ncbi:hypothetical protein DFQ01_102315 [Paenibacillus cellulosilyticus]|uniref:Uncharacterized protein n=1 Tax=Paenibacillus cellulosilyticus TaxID=375489 RepID=A0A2V2YZY7_9BACL|nr:hypothetical protein DFQ01_102315 [Paenibacillus cellulosilyticus]